MSRGAKTFSQIQAATGIPRQRMNEVLNELMLDQKAIRRVARGTYELVRKDSATPCFDGKNAGVSCSCLPPCAGAGSGQVGTMAGNFEKTYGAGSRALGGDAQRVQAAQQGHKYQFGGMTVIAMQSGSVVEVRELDHTQAYPVGKAVSVEATWLRPLPMSYFHGETPQ
jgi:hypothetical protein